MEYMLNATRITGLLALGLTLNLPAQSRSVTNQLVVHLTFDGTLQDDSGRGNHATYNSANGLITNPPAPTYVTGKLGQAFQFTTAADASKIDFASLGYPDDLKFGTDIDFSVAFWVQANATNVANDCAYIANRNWNTSSSRGWGIFAQGGANNIRVHYTVTEPSTIKFAYKPNVNVNDGAWHHLAVTCQRGGYISTYVDGVLANSTAFPAGTNTFDTADSQNGLGNPFAVNVGQDGTGAYTQGPGNNPPPAEAGTAAIIASIDDVGIWRRVLTDAQIAAIYSFGQLGTNLFNVPDVTSPVVLSFTPNNGAIGVLPNIPISVIIQDQTTRVDTNSIQLFVDGRPAAYALTKIGTTNTITYAQPFLSAPVSLHTNKLIFADNAAPTPARSTNINIYTVASWTNTYLGAPLYLENFDELSLATNAPGHYPAGWSVDGCTDPDIPGWDLLNPRSDAYLTWQIVSVGIVAANFNYADRVHNINGPTVLNGVPLAELGSKNIIFAASDQRQGGSQIDYLYTGDYDLSTQSNVWVAFNSIYTQENYQLGALEYSVDQAATWLPLLYMLSPSTLMVTNGVIDAYATLSTVDLHIPFCTASGLGNYFGAFIGVSSNLWGTLGPYISGRAAGDQYASHRIEQFRLPAADGQSKVRFRFAMAGANFWDWGFDSFGLYSRPSTPPPLRIASVASSGTNISVTWNGNGANFGGLQKATTLNPANWADIPGTIGQTNYSETISPSPVYYRAARF
jgi:hypothetical protein